MAGKLNYQLSWCGWAECSCCQHQARSMERQQCGKECYPWPWTGRAVLPWGSSTTAPIDQCSRQWWTNSYRLQIQTYLHTYKHILIPNLHCTLIPQNLTLDINTTHYHSQQSQTNIELILLWWTSSHVVCHLVVNYCLHIAVHFHFQTGSSTQYYSYHVL